MKPIGDVPVDRLLTIENSVARLMIPLASLFEQRCGEMDDV
jgi:hypothetical protein